MKRLLLSVTLAASIAGCGSPEHKKIVVDSEGQILGVFTLDDNIYSILEDGDTIPFVITEEYIDRNHNQHRDFGECTLTKRSKLDSAYDIGEIINNWWNHSTGLSCIEQVVRKEKGIVNYLNPNISKNNKKDLEKR